MKGRKPIPLEMRILKNNPGHRIIPQPIPIDLSIPKPPSHFGEGQKVLWYRVCDLIKSGGILATADFVALELLVDSYDRFLGACAKIDAAGPVTADDKLSPWVRIRDRMWEQVYKMLSEFGLSPVARTKLQFRKDSGDNDPLDLILNTRSSPN